MTVSRCGELGGNTAEISEERGRKLAVEKESEGGRGRRGGRGEGAYSESETYAATSSRKQQPEKTEETTMTEARGKKRPEGRAAAAATAGALCPPHSGARKEALGNNRKSCKKEPITCSSSCRSTTPVSRAGVPQPTPFPPSCPLLSSSSSSLPSSPPRTSSSSASASPSNGLHVTTCPKLRTAAGSDRPDRGLLAEKAHLLLVAVGLVSAVMAEMMAAVGRRLRLRRSDGSCGKVPSSLLDLFLVPNVLLAVIASSSLLWKASPPSALLEDIAGNVQVRLRFDPIEIKMQDFANSPLTSAFSPVLNVRSEKFQPRRTADPTGVYGPEESVMGWETDSHKEGNKPVSKKNVIFFSAQQHLKFSIFFCFISYMLCLSAFVRRERQAM